MLVILSDLHFREALTGEPDADYSRFSSRNLPATLFRRFFREIGTRAVEDKARRVEIVLAGDIFELTRSPLWFEQDEGPQRLRPYAPVSAFAPGSPVETLVGRILDAIAAADAAGDALEAIRHAATHIQACPGAQELPVRVHYLPGNHDRLADMTPAIRARVRALLGLDAPSERERVAPFPHVFTSFSHRTLVRHGHVYDRYNFPRDLRRAARIEADPFDPLHGEPSFGDFITVDIAACLPWLYRRIHGEAAILHGETIHRDLYRRLVQLDDLRPQSALLDFLLAVPGYTDTQVWKCLEPVAVALLERVHSDPYLLDWLLRLGRPGPDRYDLVRLVLDWPSLWKHGLSLKVVRALAAGAGARREDGDGAPAAFAAREALLADDRVRFVVAGHTHSPDMQLLRCTERGGSYYLDTGTWRERVLASLDRRHFESIKNISYCVIYSPDENPARDGRAGLESVDMWTGFSRRWLDGRLEGGGAVNRRGANTGI